MFTIEESKKLLKIYDRYDSENWDAIILFISENIILLWILIQLDEIIPISFQLSLEYIEDSHSINIYHNMPFSDFADILDKLHELCIKCKKHINRFSIVYKQR